jgi:ABC-type nickel/cobalt efflux system permease component RcnA
MKITDMVSDLESQIARNTRPWMRIAAAIVLIAFVGILIYQQVTSPVQIQKRNAKASDQFGEALQKAGIQTQAGPSK